MATSDETNPMDSLATNASAAATAEGDNDGAEGSHPPAPLTNDSLEPLIDSRSNGRHRTISSRMRRRLLSFLGDGCRTAADGQAGGTTACLGVTTIVLGGAILGSTMPSNTHLSPPTYQWISNSIGYTYFLCWSVSFYPQLLNNYRRRTTQGLSVDFAVLNVIGFACYTLYVCALYFSPRVREEYRARHGADAQISVQSNDVAFAVHALVLTVGTLGQVAYYDRERLWPTRISPSQHGHRPQEQLNHYRPSRIILCIVAVLLAIMLLTPVAVAYTSLLTWLDYFYLLSFIKIGVTLIKYVPQVVLNYRRRSTVGWSIWQILLDFTGGVLSDLQLVGDCWSLQDWSGISGNLAKLLLGFVSILFDTVFMLQHYVWYADSYEEATELRAGDDRGNGENFISLLL